MVSFEGIGKIVYAIFAFSVLVVVLYYLFHAVGWI